MIGDRHNYSTGKKGRPEAASGRSNARAEADAAVDQQGRTGAVAVSLRRGQGSVTELEKAAGWRPRYGIERLREALDDVAECRGLITRGLSPERKKQDDAYSR
jgi:hypothetical protein